MKIRNQILLMLGVIALTPMTNAEERPLGKISVDEKIVAAGSFPTIDWNIVYPGENTETLVEISPDGTVTPRIDLNMKVRVLAADVQRITTRRFGFRLVRRVTQLPVTGELIFRNGHRTRLFQGTQSHVDPSRIVRDLDLTEGQAVNFSAFVNLVGATRYTTGRGLQNILVYRNGDTPATFTTLDTQATLGTHIAAHIDSTGKIDIGPRDLIIVFELTHVAQAPESDFQDMILLLSLDPVL